MKTHPKKFTDASDHRRPLSPQDARTLIAVQKLAQLRRFDQFTLQGYSQPEAAQMLGASVTTLWRDRKKFDEAGLTGLKPLTGNCGRKSTLDKLHVSKAVLRTVEHLALQHGCSIVAAWRRFARTPGCSPKLAALIRKSVPPSLLAATKLTDVRVRVGRHVSNRAALAAALNPTKK